MTTQHPEAEWLDDINLFIGTVDGKPKTIKLVDYPTAKSLILSKLKSAEIEGRIAENRHYIKEVEERMEDLPEWKDLIPARLKYYEDRITELEAQLKTIKEAE